MAFRFWRAASLARTRESALQAALRYADALQPNQPALSSPGLPSGLSSPSRSTSRARRFLRRCALAIAAALGLNYAMSYGYADWLYTQGFASVDPIGSLTRLYQAGKVFPLERRFRLAYSQAAVAVAQANDHPRPLVLQAIRVLRDTLKVDPTAADALLQLLTFEAYASDTHSATQTFLRLKQVARGSPLAQADGIVVHMPTPQSPRRVAEPAGTTGTTTGD